jgi:hypothetical protein
MKLALVAPQRFGSVRLPQPLHHRWEPVRVGASVSRAGWAAAYSGAVLLAAQREEARTLAASHLPG